MGCVAEMFGDGQRGEPGAPARPGRLVHLAEYQCRALEHTGPSELEQQLVPLARTLAYTGKDRDPGVALDGCSDQLHNQHGLADPGAAEHRRLAAGDQRREQIDDLDAGVEDLARAALTLKRRRRGVYGPALYLGGERRTAIGRLTDRVEQPAEHRRSDRRADRRAERAGARPAPQAGGAAERYCPGHSRAEVLLYFGNQWRSQIPFDRDRFIDRRQHPARKSDVDDRAVDCGDAARTRTRIE